MQHRWDDGLPHLSQADDIRLRGIASLELAAQRTPEQIQSLGDQYWDLAGKFKLPEKRGLHLRAIYCYELGTPEAASSLQKVRQQKRLEEATTLYGAELINQILEPIRGKSASKKAS